MFFVFHHLHTNLFVHEIQTFVDVIIEHGALNHADTIVSAVLVGYIREFDRSCFSRTVVAIYQFLDNWVFTYVFCESQDPERSKQQN